MSAPPLQRLARLEHHADGAVSLGPARRSSHAGFHVLHLSGGPYDMAFQHGALLRERLATGPLPLFSRYLSLLLRESPARPIAGAIAGALEKLLHPRLTRALPPYFRAVIAGLADGSGLPERDILRAYLMPDAMVCAFAAYGRLTRAPIAPGCPYTPLFGCTSAVAGRTATRRGQLLHGRNLDFPGCGRWDTEATVAFHEPEDGKVYVGVTSAGIFGGGITGMNAAGLTFAVHQHFPRRVDWGGEPVGVVGDEVLRQAGTVGEAIDILDRHRPIAAWTYIVCDAERAIAYEVAPGARRIVPMTDDRLGYANAYQHPDLQAVEHGFFPAYLQANHARDARVHTLLAAADDHTEESVAAILADHHDPLLGHEVEIGNTISSPYTVGSVVFRPADRRFWVGQGPAPTAAGPYVGFDLNQRGPSGKPKRLSGPEPRGGARLRALSAYVDAYRASLEDDDVPGARAGVSAAAALCPNEPLYHNVAGLLALREGDAPAAEAAFRRALALGHLPGREARFRIGLAFALDLTGRRAEARVEYRAAADQAPDPFARAAARRGLRRPMTRARAAGLSVELLYADFV